jgi:diguanylate cyclase (GGDEF)-like protein
VGGALLLGIGLIAYLLALSIVRPLDRLTAGAAKVAAGDLEVELPEAGRGELGVMTEIFNHMVARLRASHGELHELSITDSLTGLANRKHLMETLEAEIERCRRYHRPLAIAMVDIDHFKRFNDTFGHLAGDEVLRRLAAIFRASLRSADFAARYGGEEFLIVLPETDAATAAEIAERIRARVAAESAQRDAVSPRITVSAGIAEAGEDENLEILIHKADAALYRAKEGGRDRVEIFEV